MLNAHEFIYFFKLFEKEQVKEVKINKNNPLQYGGATPLIKCDNKAFYHPHFLRQTEDKQEDGKREKYEDVYLHKNYDLYSSLLLLFNLLLFPSSF